MSRDSKDAAKSKKVLDDCLKLPANKVCCECGGKQPRWASTNLGCFMCIRCSGIHRNLGVHISKIKSVSLDTWPLEQAEFMATMGNDKSNAVWEFALPSNRKPVEDDPTYNVEVFIKDKYERKMFCKPEKAPKKTKGKAAAKAVPVKASKAAKKKKEESESEEDSDEESESEEEDSEDEREAAKKKKLAAKKKAVAAAKKEVKKPKSESDDEEEDEDSEEERAKAAKAKKNIKAKKGGKKETEAVATSFAAVKLAGPPHATNGHAAPAADFGSSFDTDFGASDSFASSAPPAAAASADDFFTSAADDSFAPAFKKVPSAAATKSIMDKFSASAALGGPMSSGFGQQGMPASAMPNMYAPQQQYNPYQQQQGFVPQQFQAPNPYGAPATNPYAQQQQYGGYPQQGYPQPQGFAPQSFGQPQQAQNGFNPQSPQNMQQQYAGYAQQQQQQPFGFGQTQQQPADVFSVQPQAQQAPAAAPKHDPFADFGGLTSQAAAPRKQVATPASAAPNNGFFF